MSDPCALLSGASSRREGGTVSSTKRSSRLRRWAHRKGLARQLNRCFTGGRYVSEYVETAFPWRWLAVYAAHCHGMRVASMEHCGRLRRRWHLRLVTTRWYS